MTSMEGPPPMTETRPDSAASAGDDLPVILLVDDDDATRAVLLQAVGHRYGHDYDAIAEPWAAGAIDRLQALHDAGRPVALIVADQWVPAETGADFLARSRRLHRGDVIVSQSRCRQRGTDS